MYVVFSILSTVFERMSANSIGSPTTDILSILVVAPVWSSLYSAQKHANICCGDNAGESNARLTGLNILFIVVGTIIWVFAILGLLMSIGLVPENFIS